MNLPTAPAAGLLAELAATTHPVDVFLPGMVQTDIRLPNGRGITVIHSTRHYCGENTVEVGLIYDDGSDNWPLDANADVLSEFGQRSGAVLGWVDALTLELILSRLAALPPRT